MKLLSKLDGGRAKLVGVIMFGGGIKARYWIEEHKKNGYLVLISDNHAELYK